MKYDRLTERVGKGISVKETSTNDNRSIWNAIERLAELEDKIENGTLKEVKIGKWLLEKTPDGKPYCFHCSVCDNDFKQIENKTKTDYCPNCGAKMQD